MTISLLDRRFAARPEHLGDIRRAVSEAARRAGCNDEETGDVVLAVDEACQNVIRHGYGDAEGDVIVQMEIADTSLIVRITDFAPPVDADILHPRPLYEMRPGGLGLHFIRSVMDDIAFLTPPEGAGNLLQMIKHVGARA